jgi:hypothetical protein
VFAATAGDERMLPPHNRIEGTGSNRVKISVTLVDKSLDRVCLYQLDAPLGQGCWQRSCCASVCPNVRHQYRTASSVKMMPRACYERFAIPVAQAKAEVEPNATADDLDRKPTALIQVGEESCVQAVSMVYGVRAGQMGGLICSARYLGSIVPFACRVACVRKYRSARALKLVVRSRAGGVRILCCRLFTGIRASFGIASPHLRTVIYNRRAVLL